MVSALKQWLEKLPEVRKLLICLAAIFLLRVATLNCAPFLDRTESRVALISRILSDTKTWLNLEVPQNGTLTTYRAKPPLHYWLGAISQSIFGHSEFAARLPNFVGAIVTLLFTLLLARKHLSIEASLKAAIVLFSTPLFFIVSGLTLVDASLLAFLSGALYFGMSSFQSTTRIPLSSLTSSAFFLSLAIATKGPVALILFWGAVLVWLIWDKKFWSHVKAIAVHFLITGLLVAPFFALLEAHSPGYIKYMLLTENFGRFFKGDATVQFGSVHKLYFGLGLAYGLLGFLPWTIVVFRNLFSTARLKETDSYSKFIICSALWPIIFFSLTRSTLATYILPSLPFLSILVAKSLEERQQSLSISKLALISLFILLGCLYLGTYADLDVEHTIYSLLFAGAFACMGLSLKKQTSVLNMGLFCVILVAAATMSLNAYLLDRFSSKHVIELVKKSDPNKALSFVWETPYSAYLYDSVLYDRVVKSRQKADCEGPVVSRNKDLLAVKGLLASDQIQRRHGKWTWIENGCALIETQKNVGTNLEGAEDEFRKL